MSHRAIYKWEAPHKLIGGQFHLYKLYGYGLCKGKPTPKIACLGT